MKITIGYNPLTLENIAAVSKGGVKVEIDPRAKKQIKASRQFLEDSVASGKTLYGVNTGFGSLSSVKISEDKIEDLQLNLLRSHATGVGAPLPADAVRVMLLLRAANLAKGFSGVRMELIEKILELLNKDVLPWVPCQGSVGASGDLAPLSHLALPLVGEGRVLINGKAVDAKKALIRAKIKPLRLNSKEGLALINGTQFMTALGSLALIESEKLLDWADVLCALSLEATRGTSAAYEAEIHEVRPHPGQTKVAKRLRELLAPKGKSSQISKSHEGCGKVQDPYSFRCVPQVHGASRDAVDYVRRVLEIEINSVTDNPLVFSQKGKILSGGNFHGQVVSMALDFLAIAMSEIANISEQRIQKLINPQFSDLPAFLTDGSGLNSGFMIVQVAAAAIVSENKTLSHPAVVDSIPTSTDKEDHVSMGAWASRKARMVVDNCRKVLTMELLVASQGIEFLRPLKTSEPLEKVLKLVRQRIKPIKGDRIFAYDLEKLEPVLSLEL